MGLEGDGRVGVVGQRVVGLPRLDEEATPTAGGVGKDPVHGDEVERGASLRDVAKVVRSE